MTDNKIDALKTAIEPYLTLEKLDPISLIALGGLVFNYKSSILDALNTRPQAQSGDVIIPYNSEADRQLDIALRIGKRTDEGHVECFFKEEHLNQFKAALSQAQGVDLGKVITALIDAENGLKHMNVPENSPERRQCREALEEIRGKK